MKKSPFSELRRWMAGEELLLELENRKPVDRTGGETSGAAADVLSDARPVRRVQKAQLKSFSVFYAVCAALCCAGLIAALLLTVAKLPEYGLLSDNAAPLEEEYLKEGAAETGAANIVSAIILGYRAFDTLGESFVLFTALVCAIVLLRLDGKNEREQLPYYDLSGDSILRRSVSFAAPMSILFGFYVMFNGHLSPGGGFSGGAIAGAGMILLSAAFGFEKIDRFFTERLFKTVCFSALCFYLLSKTYTFLMEANGLETHVPKGLPGSIFSAGLILPLNLAVGVVVSMTVFGIYCLFRRGAVGASGAKGGKSDESDP